MAAYLIADLEVLDPDGMKDYHRQVPETVAAFGGRYLVRGGAQHPVEGEWAAKRVVVIEFPDLATAQAWYASPAYQAILPLRLRHSRARFMSILEGV